MRIEQKEDEIDRLNRFFRTEELGSTQGSRIVKNGAKALMAVIDALKATDLPNRSEYKKLLMPLFADVHDQEAYTKVVWAYVEKTEQVKAAAAASDSVLLSIKKVQNSLKGCRCGTSGKCTTCVCAEAGGQCNQARGCKDGCTRPGHKDDGLLKDVKKKMKKAAKKAVEKEKGGPKKRRELSRSRSRKARGISSDEEEKRHKDKRRRRKQKELDSSSSSSSSSSDSESSSESESD